MNTRFATLGILALGFAIAANATLDKAALAAQYPLRVHIYTKKTKQYYSGGALDNSQVAGKQIDRRDRMSLGANGRGSGNLFENGEPRGFDFSFDCADNFIAQRGGDTYPARWLKKDKQLEIVVGYYGDKDRVLHCTLKTEMQDFAYHKHNGKLVTMSIAERKQWMKDHDYDPEHGKNDIKDKQE